MINNCNLINENRLDLMRENIKIKNECLMYQVIFGVTCFTLLIINLIIKL